MSGDGGDATGWVKIKGKRGDDGVLRDQWKRYLLPDPETGKVQPWTRVTTIAGELKDRYGLERWDQRNVVWGVGQVEHLFVSASAARLSDVQTLDDIADKAKERAAASAGADIGSALHTFAERMDRGEEVNPPERFVKDLEAYRKGLELAGITTVDTWLERIVIIPEIAAAGTLDRLNVAPEWTLPRIGDLKTAAEKPNANGSMRDPITTFGMQDIPLQMAMYANATHYWDPVDEVMVEMPPVDHDRAMIFHVPAGQGQCRIYEIDLRAGWEAVKLAVAERAWRKRKDLYQLVLSIDMNNGDVERPEAAANWPTSTPKGDDGTKASKGAAVEPVNNGAANTGAPVGEAVPSSAEDPPVPPSSPGRRLGEASLETHLRLQELYGKVDPPEWTLGNGPPEITNPLAPADPVRWAWCQQRVNAIKDWPDPEAKRRLAGLWSLVDVIPLFPNEANPNRSGPRTWAELSKVIGLVILVEAQFAMPFPEIEDPNPDITLPTPGEARKAARDKATADATKPFKKAAARKRAAAKAKAD